VTPQRPVTAPGQQLQTREAPRPRRTPQVQLILFALMLMLFVLGILSWVVAHSYRFGLIFLVPAVAVFMIFVRGTDNIRGRFPLRSLFGHEQEDEDPQAAPQQPAQPRGGPKHAQRQSQQPPYQPDNQPAPQPGYESAQQPDYSPTEQSGYPSAQQPNYQQGYQPVNQSGQQPSYQPAQQPGYPPAQQPGYQPVQQQAGYQPALQPGYQPVQQPGYPPAQQQPGYQSVQQPDQQQAHRTSAPLVALQDPAAGQAGPPSFGRSKAGQAAWHLPVSQAASGLAADAARLGDLEIRAASVVGPDHRCDEPARPRQDAYALGRTADGRFLVIAVADGVGQSKHADIGARVAVSAAVTELAELAGAGRLPQDAAASLFTKIARKMAGTARSRSLRDQDVCSILITAVIPTAPRHDGTRPMWVAWLGDVSMWVMRDKNLQRVTGGDKAGLDMNTLDAVLPFNPDRAHERNWELQPGDRVALMTDGLSDSFQAIPAAFDYFTAQWAGPPPHPTAFLQDLCYDAPAQADDRTVVVTWCGDPDPASASNGRR
jgi:serine/threonine protein phosphatase PrpC